MRPIWLAAAAFILALTISGCSSAGNGATEPPAAEPSASATLGNKPPLPEVKVGGEAVQAYQGTYCWQSGCADYAAPEQMLEGKAIPVVPAGSTLTVAFAGKQPTETTLSWSRNETRSEAVPFDGSLQVPREPGVYYYLLSAVWLKDREKQISEGDSSYVFAVEVK